MDADKSADEDDTHKQKRMRKKLDKAHTLHRRGWDYNGGQNTYNGGWGNNYNGGQNTYNGGWNSNNNGGWNNNYNGGQNTYNGGYDSDSRRGNMGMGRYGGGGSWYEAGAGGNDAEAEAAQGDAGSNTAAKPRLVRRGYRGGRRYAARYGGQTHYRGNYRQYSSDQYSASDNDGRRGGW